MEENARIAVITTATNMAGPVGDNFFKWQDRVLDAITTIMEMASPGSRVSKLLDGMAASKVIFGTVRSIVKEESSTRGLLTIESRVSQWSKDGIETARTERCGVSGKPESGVEMAKYLETLIGHKVQLWVENEVPRDAPAGTKGFRVIRHAKDLGKSVAAVA